MKYLIGLIFVATQALAETDVIIGRDDRVRVVDYRDTFHQAVGHVEIHDPAQKKFCSGTLISSRHVLTNAHCVTKRKSKLTRQEIMINPGTITFSVGRLGATQSRKTIRVKQTHTFERWLATRDTSFDVAVMELAEEVKGPHARFQVQQDPEDLRNDDLYLSGYSAGKAYGTMWMSRGEFELPLHNGRSFLHTMDMEVGSSGSSIRKSLHGEWVIVGVNRGSYVTSRLRYNEAVLITQTVFDAICRWVKN